MTRRSKTGAIVSILVFIAVMVLISSTSATLTPDPDVLTTFDDLISYINSLPDNPNLPADFKINKGLVISLYSQVENAEAAYLRGQPCTAANILRAYLNYCQGLRNSRNQPVMDDLYNRGRSLLHLLIGSLPEDQVCTGFERIDKKPAFNIIVSDNIQFSSGLVIGEAKMWTVEADGEQFTEISIPGLNTRGNEPGKPGVPIWRRLIAVPRGAEVSISLIETPEIAETAYVNLYPAQIEPADQPDLFDDPPFVKDETTYATDAPYPPDVCSVDIVGMFRDLELALVSCASGQYNPVSDELILFADVSYDVEFTGGTGTFITESALQPFENPTISQLVQPVANFEIVGTYIAPESPITPICQGEEFLILTHPNFRSVADSLAGWKNSKGILTNVFTVSDGTGPGPDTNEEIDDFIEDRYNDCRVRPYYILLIGDYGAINAFYANTGNSYGITCNNVNTATDFPYAYRENEEFTVSGETLALADFAVGRISVDTEDEARAVIDKIIQYEKYPPYSSEFYKDISFASYFQCCRDDVTDDGTDERRYIETSELIHDQMVSEGYSVERIYSTSTAAGSTTYVNLGRNPTPTRYYDGTLLPQELSQFPAWPDPPFAWAGSTQAIINAIDDGRFLFFHRDHGWWNQLWQPNFTVTDATADLTNGNLLPVFFNIDCLTGWFDLENDPGVWVWPPGVPRESLAEVLLREPNAGAIGVIAATRCSPSNANNALAVGLFDAVWPDVDLDYGTDMYGRNSKKLGNILNYGKLYMLNQIGSNFDVTWATGRSNMYLYHVFGDPTLEMWTENPHPTIHILDVTSESYFDHLSVYYAVEGAEITAFQETEEGINPIGRSKVEGGVATLPFMTEPLEGNPIFLSVRYENGISFLLNPAEPPTPEVPIPPIPAVSDSLVEIEYVTLDSSGHYTGQFYYEVPISNGPDGAIGTSDDELYRYFIPFRNPDNTVEHEEGYYDPGPDGEWYTADDPITQYETFDYDSHDNRTARYRFYDPGSDGIWGTGDDLMFRYYYFYYDANDRRTGSIYYDDPGYDETWFTADDEVNQIEKWIYLPDGKIDHRIQSRDPGPDGQWFTSDDVIYSYSLPEYDSNGVLSRSISYNQGIDGVWFTSDDEMTGYSLFVEYTSAECTYYYGGPGTDGVWFQ